MTYKLKSQFLKELGKKIKTERKKRKKTQEETAKAIGLHQAAFSRIESGLQEITVCELVLLCREFKMEVMDLI